MTDYGIKPPTAIFGRLKTGDEVKVNFELTVGAKAIAAALSDSRNDRAERLEGLGESLTERQGFPVRISPSSRHIPPCARR